MYSQRVNQQDPRCGGKTSCGVGTVARLGDNGWVSGKKTSDGPPSTRCSGGEAVDRPHFCIMVTMIIFQSQRKDLQGQLVSLGFTALG